MSTWNNNITASSKKADSDKELPRSISVNL